MIFKDNGAYSGAICTAEPRPALCPLRLPRARFARTAKLSSGDSGTGNAIIHSDNLAALRQLRASLRGKVRCIYLDPPYNNREIYNHYDDDLSHEEWLSSMCERLEEMCEFLSDNGSIWISIDDRECHYLKVAADKVFGRDNFITAIIWQQRTTRENRRAFSVNHEYLLVYASDAKLFRRHRNLLPATAEQSGRYRNPDNDLRGAWQSVSANVQAGHATPSQFYVLVAPNGRRHSPPNGRCWVYSKERMAREIAAGNVWFGKDGNGVPRLKRFQTASVGLNPPTLWLADDVGTTDAAKKHLLKMFADAPVFDTPKPEALLAHILHIATAPGDLVLDPYLGSGTTAAVAHKMGRQYLGIEVSKAAANLCASRLKKVVEGEDGGISRQCGWRGGGGFDFYRQR
jgi:adenine-specific DNA-methyltransferase